MPGRKQKTCSICEKFKFHIAKGLCNTCYKKYGVPKVTCIKCNKLKIHHAHQLCKSCYIKKYYKENTENIKRFNIKKLYNIDYELWKEITQKCLVCEFDKVVDLHHLDKNHKNNSKDNFIGLCPNHHRMLHDSRFSEGIQAEIDKKLKQNSD